MWLGISLIAVFDFVETVVMLMKYSLRKMGLLKNRNRIQNFHGEIKIFKTKNLLNTTSAKRRDSA